MAVPLVVVAPAAEAAVNGRPSAADALIRAAALGIGAASKLPTSSASSRTMSSTAGPDEMGAGSARPPRAERADINKLSEGAGADDAGLATVAHKRKKKTPYTGQMRLVAKLYRQGGQAHTRAQTGHTQH